MQINNRMENYREGDIGGYPVPGYRKKNWQIPKFRVENRRNTDTAFMIGHAYLKLYPSHVFVYLKHVYVVVNFLFQLIFIFPLFWGMVMYANEFKTKEKQKLTEIKI